MEDLTPRRIVERLDGYIVGQAEAKRAVAIALRNRWRRRQLDEEMRREITPKNIIMIGPTGVGKTEIARRLAALVDAPFLKIEATKYTEVGYYGRDVESMIRDLVEVAFRLVKEKKREEVRTEAEEAAERRVLDLLLPDAGEDEEDDEFEPVEVVDGSDGDEYGDERPKSPAAERRARRERARAKMREKLVAGKLEDRKVTLKTERKNTPVQIFSNMGVEQMDVELQSMFDKFMPKESRDRQLTVREARKILLEQEVEKLIDRESAGEEAVALAEEAGIIFLDEIDKVCGENTSKNTDVSRQGVQRDLLPIVEGASVQTRYGTVHTEHILFIAAGAFHMSKPSDLMPELQGRFPIRVELTDLKLEDFVRILREPKNSITRQYAELLGADGVNLTFSDDAYQALAEIAVDVNRKTENIGARRLHTVLEKLLEEASFDAPDNAQGALNVDAAYVRERLAHVSADEDLSRYIL